MIKPAIIILPMLLVPALASADPHFEILDRGNAVEVIGRDIHTARTTITVARQRMEIPLATIVPAKRAMTGDATIQVAEIDPDSKAVSIKLNIPHDGVVALAKYAQAMQIGDDLHVLFPRKLPEAGQTVTLPEPTLPVVNKIEEKKPEAAKEEPKPEAKAEEKKIEEPKPEEKTEAKAEEPKKAAAAIKGVGSNGLPQKEEPPKLGTADEGSGTPTSTYVGAGLLAAAAGIWLWKKKKSQSTAAGTGATPTAPATIDIIAQRSLGGRAKVIWLGAGDRELMVAVTPTNVSVLGQWTKASSLVDAPVAERSVEKRSLPMPAPKQQSQSIPVATANQNHTASQTSQIAVPRTTTQSRAQTQGDAAISPALSGLLRLRERSMPTVSEEVATDDAVADATWARELLAATNAQSGRRS